MSRPAHLQQPTAYERAVMLHRAGKLAEAATAYRKVLDKQHSHSPALNNLGLIEKTLGNYAEAMKLYDRALQYKPDSVDALVNKGNLLQITGRYTDSIPLLEKAVSLNPKHTAALVTLGWGYIICSQNVKAAKVLEAACELQPNNPTAWQNLSTAYYRQGLLEKAIKVSERCVKDYPTAVSHSNLLLISHFSPNFSLQQMYDMALSWAERYEKPHIPPKEQWPKKQGDADKKLKVGFISGDFRMHPVSYFFASMLEARKASDHWEAVLYADNAFADSMTERLAKASLKLTHCDAMSDDRLAAEIRNDQIDILFDLTGHTGKNRLLAFARKPAPIQATWIGYFDTTGMETMDYLLADPIALPLTMQPYCREKIIHMPDDFLCYDPPGNAPDVNPLPAEQNGYITFGSANQITKLTNDVIALWTEVMNAVPDSRLILKTKAFCDMEVKERYKAMFHKAGLDTNRLELEGPGSQMDMLQYYNRIDIGLDPFPCAGGTTTCEALWMGVPVITLLGERFCNRHSASHMHNAGVEGTIAESKEDYLAKAVAMAGDITSLAVRRKTMRATMAKSPLCDATRFADHFAKVLRRMWTEHAG